MTEAQQFTLVVPCYNEVSRLDEEAFIALIDRAPTITLLFVDDGSQDGTAALHAKMAARRPGRIETSVLPDKRGKAEAVRQGLVQALRGSATAVGFIDADLATPAEEVERLCTVFLKSPDCDVLLGSRIRLMGRSIDRHPWRHYLGRIFATMASSILRLPFYDTQCGAKLFRRTGALLQALEQPFLSRWAFDVELLGRLLIGTQRIPPIPPGRILEEPLRQWRDCKGSKIGSKQMMGALLDLGRIEIALKRRRKATLALGAAEEDAPTSSL